MSSDKKLCGHPYQGDTCGRFAGHDGEHMLVEYRAIKHHPFHEVHDNFVKQIGAGSLGLQSWTCDGCGAVERMSQINGWYEEGECENCGHVTNLVKKGCNFTLMMPIAGAQRADLKRLMESMGYKPPPDN